MPRSLDKQDSVPGDSGPARPRQDGLASAEDDSGSDDQRTRRISISAPPRNPTPIVRVLTSGGPLRKPASESESSTGAGDPVSSSSSKPDRTPMFALHHSSDEDHDLDPPGRDVRDGARPAEPSRSDVEDRDVGAPKPMRKNSPAIKATSRSPPPTLKSSSTHLQKIAEEKSESPTYDHNRREGLSAGPPIERTISLRKSSETGEPVLPLPDNSRPITHRNDNPNPPTPTHTDTGSSNQQQHHRGDKENQPAKNRLSLQNNASSSSSSVEDSSGGLHLKNPSSSSLTQPTKKSSKQACTIACQVEEDELLAKTIATQVNDEELRRYMAPSTHSGEKGHKEDDRSDNERDDVVNDRYLRPVSSSTHLHGILRKTPSAKWGSASTVCFDENGGDRSRSMSLIDTPDQTPTGLKGNKLSDVNLSRSDSHGNLKASKHRNGSIGKMLATFHLGHHEDTPSEVGSTVNLSPSSKESKPMTKHASFAELPRDDETAEKKKEPFWRKCFPKKKAMTRSFTMDDLKKDLQMDDHLIPEDELFEKLKVDPHTGLTEEEAAARLARDGKNCLTPPKKVPEWAKLLHELVGGFSPLLEVGAILCFIAYGIQWSQSSDPPGDNLYLAIVLLCVVLLTSFFLYAQKAKSERIMEGFSKMLPQSAKVVRNKQTKEIMADNLVLGDIVELHGGDRIPADIRILEATSMKVDNSSLTGESEPQARKPESSENPLESKNLVFYTTNCVEGVGRGIVVRRGDGTVMGRIAKLTTRIDTSETTIAREMRHFVMLICIFAFIMGVLCIVVALALGYDILYAIILAIGLVVANVPEGIIITVTVMLTLTAKRMAKKNCLIKNLEAVETLGACSVICSDKTGTLTQNRMTVAHCWVDDQIHATDTTTESLAGKNLPESETINDLIRIATLCNRAKFKPDQGEKPIYARECTGDASETALLKFTEIITGDALAEREKNKAQAEIPFNSTTKFQVSVHETEIDKKKRYIVVMKGAPERIWERCSTIASRGKEHKKDKAWSEKFDDAYVSLGGMGERVLGFCDYLLPEDKYPIPTKFDPETPNFPLENLRFVGLISLIDPPRAAVPDGVAKCRSAGIQVIMVTGDHPVTAKAIARSVGIISEGMETVEDIAQRTGVKVEDVNPRDAQAIVIHGGTLRDMKDEDIDDVLRNHSEIVFARTSPQQKLIIVEACQRSGAVVAVTGDGVNDSPALKKANIGIAMGITGSDVSKQAADIVLLDDNFASIVTGIEEGRLIFDNLKKTICYTLMSNIPEICPVVLYFLLSIPLGLQTIPMLLICLGTDMIPSISMAHESAEADIMKLPPRDPEERLVSTKLIHCTYLQAGTICSAGAFFAYFVVLGSCGWWPRKVVGLRDDWENENINDLRDSYGQEWTFRQRLILQWTVEASFFASVVVYQWVDLICRKVRRKSVFQKGMRNWFLNFALVFETAVTAFCIYVPGLNNALSLNGIFFIWWLPVIPFALYFFVYDELRRYLIRRYPGGWMEREFLF